MTQGVAPTFSPDQVRRILARSAEGWSQRRIATYMSVSPRAVRKVLEDAAAAGSREYEREKSVVHRSVQGSARR